MTFPYALAGSTSLIVLEYLNIIIGEKAYAGIGFITIESDLLVCLYKDKISYDDYIIR
jgi:hypothetical protein